MAFGRPFRDNPAAWIALGVVGVLAIPPVRRALRAATVSAAVGVLKLGDRLADVGGRVTEESKAILADASDKREQWRQHEQQGSGESWLRKTVVGGLASTLGVADNVSEGARRTFFRGRSAVQMETGAIGGSDAQAPTLSEGASWQAVESAATENVPEQKVLPEHLMPKPLSSTQAHPHTGRHVPGDLAVRNPEALAQFADAVEEVGAGLKPEYQELLETVMSDIQPESER
ncbi:MAG: hypothetical protein OWT28_00995 [Firmicutes bacterium]|nr:hypothetical protein [Bacillota bacterium]